MQQVISTGWTLIFKILVPSFSVVVSLYLLLLLLFYPTDSYLDGLVVTSMSVVATVFFCWLGAKLKQVCIDENNLYVAGLFKEISIPLTCVDSIGDIHGGAPVILRLKEKSEFGRTILFAAKWRPVFPWEQHPILGELRQLIKEKQNCP